MHTEYMASGHCVQYYVAQSIEWSPHGDEVKDHSVLYNVGSKTLWVD